MEKNDIENKESFSFPQRKRKVSQIVKDPPCYSEAGVCPTPDINCIDCEREYIKEDCVMKKEERKIEELVICQCHNAEHQLMFRAEDIDETGEKWVFVDFHLCPIPFWKRLWHGLKYIFGYRCKYGDFDEVVLSKEHADKLQRVVDYLREK